MRNISYLMLAALLLFPTSIPAQELIETRGPAGRYKVDVYKVPTAKPTRRQKITPEDLRQVPNYNSRETFFIVEKDGRYMVVDPLISQQLR